MMEPAASAVDINGFSCRVWTAGSGPKIGFLAGFGGLPKWVPFLDALARERTVVVPSLPGFPGGERGHTVLDSHLDWVLAAPRIGPYGLLATTHRATDPSAQRAPDVPALMGPNPAKWKALKAAREG